jgi:hypothetical protein
MYLFIQNINTRYPYVFPIFFRNAQTIMSIIRQCHEEHPIYSLTGDGEGAWATSNQAER